MKLSKTSEYALRILIYMGKDVQRLYSAKQLVEALAISDKYLRRLMTDLTKSGIVASIQGRDGGYVIAKRPEEIKLADIIEAIEGMDKYTGCLLGFENCSDDKPCALHTSLGPIREEFFRVFTQKSLNDLDYNIIGKY
ncbi:MAG TPA: Rrf2 family transcriptional regulator [Bacteroidales bacterium]|nr:Rrf2 family transcriptional regulator [Bacteroidales bacterium]